MLNQDLDFLFHLVFDQGFRAMMAQASTGAALLPPGLEPKHLDLDEAERFAGLVANRLLGTHGRIGTGFPLTLKCLAQRGQSPEAVMAGYLASPVFRQVVEVEPHGPGISHAEAFLLYLTLPGEGPGLDGCLRDLAEHEALSSVLKEYTMAGDPVFDLRSPRLLRLGNYVMATLCLPAAVWMTIQEGSLPKTWPPERGPLLRIFYAGGQRFLCGRIPEADWAALKAAAMLPWLGPGERGRHLVEAGLPTAWVDLLGAA